MSPKYNDGGNDNSTGKTDRHRSRELTAERSCEPSPRHRRRAQHLNRDAHRLRADAFIETEHHREEERNHQAVREGRFKRAGEDRADRARAHCHQQPWKTKAEHSPRRCTANLLEMKAEDFEDVITNGYRRPQWLLAFTQNFFGE